MPLMFSCDAESDTVKVKFCEAPTIDVPDDGDKESAVGEPPVAPQVPTATHPEFADVSPAYRYSTLLPAKLAVNVMSTVITTAGCGGVICVLAPFRTRWASVCAPFRAPGT